MAFGTMPQRLFKQKFGIIAGGQTEQVKLVRQIISAIS